MHMRWHDVCGREPMFYWDHHLPPTLNLWKKLLSFSQKAIMVFIMLELHEPHWVLVCLTLAPLLFQQLCVSFNSSSSWSRSSCSHSYYSSKIAFLMFLSSHSCYFPCSCYSFKLTFLMFSKLTFLLFFLVAFLLLQAHILVALLSCVLVTPSSNSCCSSQSCSHCSKLIFKCCFS
jgi:hypothetical protein